MASTDFVDILEEWANLVTNEIRDNLVSKDAWFDRSNLAQEIIALPIEQTQGGYMISIQLPEYAYWVDKGRNKSDKMPPLGKLEDWITRRGIATPLRVKVKVKTKKGIRFANRSFKTTLESRKSMAFGIGKKIQKGGYESKGKGFYSEIFNEDRIEELTTSLAAKFGQLFEAEIVEELT